MLDVGMDRIEGDTACVGSGIFISVESPRIGYTQEIVLEDSSTLKFSYVFINS